MCPDSALSRASSRQSGGKRLLMGGSNPDRGHGSAEVRNIERDHNRLRRAKPPARRGPRNAQVRRDGDVPGALDEISEVVIVALLGAAGGRHGKGSSAGRSRRLNSSTRWAASVGVATTRAAKCKMSVRTAPRPVSGCARMRDQPLKREGLEWVSSGSPEESIYGPNDGGRRAPPSWAGDRTAA